MNVTVNFVVKKKVHKMPVNKARFSSDYQFTVFCLVKSFNLVRFSNFINIVGSFRSDKWLGI